jgi:hypothetical protein
MFRHIKSDKLIGSFLALFSLVTLPLFAHEVKVSNDVAATFHVEPNDQPKVGVPSQAWFVLTRRGGKTIPLSECNCKLSVYLLPQDGEDRELIATPTLSPVSVEQFKDIPGASVTFPRRGLYQFELTGSARSGASFRPFKLTYKIKARK